MSTSITRPYFLAAALFLLAYIPNAQAQGNDQASKQSNTETFGNTFNIGLGISYYGYIGQTLPVVHANFELNVTEYHINNKIGLFLDVSTGISTADLAVHF